MSKLVKTRLIRLTILATTIHAIYWIVYLSKNGYVPLLDTATIWWAEKTTIHLPFAISRWFDLLIFPITVGFFTLITIIGEKIDLSRFRNPETYTINNNLVRMISIAYLIFIVVIVLTGIFSPWMGLASAVFSLLATSVGMSLAGSILYWIVVWVKVN